MCPAPFEPQPGVKGNHGDEVDDVLEVHEEGSLGRTRGQTNHELDGEPDRADGLAGTSFQMTLTFRRLTLTRLFLCPDIQKYDTYWLWGCAYQVCFTLTTLSDLENCPIFQGFSDKICLGIGLTSKNWHSVVDIPTYANT